VQIEKERHGAPCLHAVQAWSYGQLLGRLF